MLESLSESKRRLLLSLNLCTPADLRRARRHVRRLARDLPAFDSVWIDALVQLRRLTPFQARILESSNPEQIRLGPCVLIRRIGAGPFAETFLARGRRATDQYVIKVLRSDRPLSGAVEERLRDVVSRLRGLKAPYVVGPENCHRVAERFVLISPPVTGPHLGELLVRRGRFPAGVVKEIARQLAAGLAELESRGVPHGDIRADNVRLTSAGVARLVDAGIRGALENDVSVHSGLPPAHYDGIAPELIGTSSGPTTQTDLYALGCLLWQLLAGRPPFPAGDPLLKLSAHQSRDVDDVRNWAPQAPANLAEGILALTRRDPAKRPRSFVDVVERWGAPGPSGRRTLSRFLRQFDQPAPLPRERRMGRSRRRALVPVLLFIGVLAGLWWLPPSRAVLLSWGAQWPGRSGQIVPPPEAESAPPSKDAEPVAREGVAEVVLRTTELPAPDPQGVLRLGAGERYRARSLTHVGHLRIVGSRERPAVILIDEPQWELTAETIRMEGVSLRSAFHGAEPASAARPLVVLHAQAARLESCLFSDSGRDLLQWARLSASDHRNVRLSFRDCLFEGPGSAVVADAGPRIEFVNCLQLGGTALCQVSGARTSQETELLLDRTTCRGTELLIRLADPERGAGRLSIDARNCVFDVDPEVGTLLEVLASDVSRVVSRVHWTGEGSVVPAGLAVAARVVDPADANRSEPLEIPLEGLVATEYRFVGASRNDPAESEIADCDAPRRSPLPPGIQAAELPHWD